MALLWALRPPGRRLLSDVTPFGSCASSSDRDNFPSIPRVYPESDTKAQQRHDHRAPGGSHRGSQARAKPGILPSRELAAHGWGEAQLKLRADRGRRASGPGVQQEGKYFMERADLYRTTLEKYLALPRLATAIDPNDPITVGKIIRELIDEPGGLDLHLGMFMPPSRARATKSTETLAAHVHQAANHRNLRSDGARSRHLHSRSRDHGDVRRGEGAVYHPLAHAHGDQVVAGRDGKDVHARGRHGAAHHPRPRSRPPRVRRADSAERRSPERCRASPP